MGATTDNQAAGRFPPGMGWRFALAYTALFMPFAVVTPYLQVLLRSRGLDKAAIGQVQGVLELLAVIAPPVWGYLADRWQRPRQVLTVMVLGAIPSFLLFAVVGRVWTAMAVAALFGFFFRGQISLTDGLTFRYIHDHDGNYGAVRIGGSISFVLTVGALEVLGVGGARGPHLILAAVAATALFHAVSIRALPADTPAGSVATDRAPRLDWRIFCRRNLLLITLAGFLARIAMMTYYGFFTLFLRDEFNFSQAGLLWMIGPLAEIPMIFFSDRIIRRIGLKALLLLGLGGIALRLCGLSLAPGIAWVVPLQLLHALTFGAWHCASVNYVSRAAPAHMKSVAQATFAAVTIGLGGIVGGVVGGQIAETWDYRALYGTGSVLAVIAFIIVLAAVSTPAKALETAPHLDD